MPLRPDLRSVLHRCAGTAAFDAAVRVADRMLPGRRGLLTVLTYHRVDEPDRHPELFPGLVSATPEEFDAQLGLVAAQSNVVSLAELVEVREGRADLPPRAVLLTFDDAYADFADVAWPLLRRHGLPATLFVPTAYPDAPARAFWWDRLHEALHRATAPAVVTPVGRLPLEGDADRTAAYRALRAFLKSRPHEEAMGVVDGLVGDLEAPPGRSPVLGWDRLRTLAAEGVALAPHSRTHPLLTRVGRDRLVDEVQGSLADLHREVGATAPVFAYPGGGIDDAVAGTLADAGYRLAFTTERGNEPLDRRGRGPDWLRLRRVNVGRRTTPALLRAQLLPVPLPPRRHRAVAAARSS